jgi:hypothetical protein
MSLPLLHQALISVDVTVNCNSDGFDKAFLPWKFSGY